MASPASDFFERYGLSENDKLTCQQLAYPLLPVRLSECSLPQGQCSYTVFTRDDATSTAYSSASKDCVVQFRPTRFALDLDIANDAKAVYYEAAPDVKWHRRVCFESSAGEDIVLHMYSIERIAGVPYSTIQPHTRELSPALFPKQALLVRDFAKFVARSWPTPQSRTPSKLADGKVGTCIAEKLRKLDQQLPSLALRHHARRVLEKLPEIKMLPTVLNHGDVVPSNIMVDKDTGHLNGLVDWAEAEHLPFGICLYGLEFLLGFVDSKSVGTPRFYYHTEARELRELFWVELRSCIPALDNPPTLEAVRDARTLGVLLWHGFAWDDGAINRVVDRETDPLEVHLLEMFLGFSSNTHIRHDSFLDAEGSAKANPRAM